MMKKIAHDQPASARTSESGCSSRWAASCRIDGESLFRRQIEQVVVVVLQPQSRRLKGDFRSGRRRSSASGSSTCRVTVPVISCGPNFRSLRGPSSGQAAAFRRSFGDLDGRLGILCRRALLDQRFQVAVLQFGLAAGSIKLTRKIAPMRQRQQIPDDIAAHWGVLRSWGRFGSRCSSLIGGEFLGCVSIISPIVLRSAADCRCSATCWQRDYCRAVPLARRTQHRTLV